MKRIGWRRWLGAADLRRAREAVQPLRGLLAGQRRELWLAALVSISIAGLELLRPWPIQWIFDRLLLPAQPELGAPASEWLLPAACAAIVAISLAIGGLEVLRAVAVASVGRKASTRLRRMLFEHLHRLAFPFHQQRSSGDLLMRLMGDVNLVRDLLFASWLALLSRGTLFVATAAVMLVIDPMIAAVALSPLPLLLVAWRRHARTLADVTRKQRRKEGTAAALAADSLRQIRVVKAYGAEDVLTRRFARESRSGDRAGATAARLAASSTRWSNVLTGCGLAAVLYCGARAVQNGALTAGELLVLLSYARSLYKPLRGLAGEGNRLAKATACAERILDVLRREPEPRGSGAPAPVFRGALRAVDLAYRWDDAHAALEAVSFEIRAGEMVWIQGPNGAGKSTLFALLLRLIEPQRGRIEIDGEDIAGYELTSYRARFAYVPQELQLFGATLRENLLYGRPEATDEELEAAVRAALLDEWVARSPLGLDTPIGEAGKTLSGGEARRLMIARAALRDARLLLFDEPFESLDVEARAEVAHALRRVAAGRTVLVISHAADLELPFDRILRLEAGRMVDASAERPLAEALR